jgi:hypothetical protein
MVLTSSLMNRNEATELATQPRQRQCAEGQAEVMQSNVAEAWNVGACPATSLVFSLVSAMFGLLLKAVFLKRAIVSHLGRRWHA